MSDIFEGLNSSQIEAVSLTEGPVRIIAGAGSGKTRTLTHRYAYLVEGAGIPPSNILCVTFTNKAAGEMKKRVRQLIGDGYDNSLITTYHGFCVRVLREDIYRLKWPDSFNIIAENDQRKILTEIYSELDIKMDKGTFEKILDAVHRVKTNENYVPYMLDGNIDGIAVPPASPADAVDPLETVVVRRYIEKQRNIFGLDFDDLVAFTFVLFESYKETAEKWAERLYYIQVDEFQDSSRRELRLLKILASHHGNIFVVGDPDQNIYEWRGADMSIIIDFDKHFPGAETVMLNRNYRSTGNILKAANTLISHNKNRVAKDLYTASADGNDVIHLHSKTENDESKWICDEISRLMSEEGYSYKDIAVLYRSGFLSRFIEQAFMNASIPYELYGSLRFYERMEIKDTLAYMKLIQRNDDESFERIINTPRRGFGKAKLAKLKFAASCEHLSLYETLSKYSDEPEFSKTGAREFVDMIDNLRAMNMNKKPVSELMKTVLEQSGYEDYIRSLGSMERLDNLAECKRSVWEKEQSYGEYYPLSEFMRQTVLDSDTSDDSADKVKLMTIHASKGLEFPAVFVCGFTEGVFPSGRTLEERGNSGLEEERRLCFVALTRAMKRLYITESEGTGSDKSSKRPSRFIWDIGEENYKRIGTIPKELMTESKAGIENSVPERLGKGDVVTHPVFGAGVIAETDEKKGIYYVDFGKVRRPVSMKFAFGNGNALNESRKAAAKKAADDEKQTVIELGADDFREKNDVPEDIKMMNEALPEIMVPEIPAESEPVLPEKIICETDNIPESYVFDELPDADNIKTEEHPETTEVNPEMPERYRNAEWSLEPDGSETNLWKRADVPHEGWTCTGIIDLGNPVGTCRMCGYQIIRYVHIMKHPSYYRTIGAGCVCAGRMEGDPEKARERENAFKNRMARRETFLASPHKTSRNGNMYIKYKGKNITVIEDRFREGQYKYVMDNRFSGTYNTAEEALLGAFDEIDPEII